MRSIFILLSAACVSALVSYGIFHWHFSKKYPFNLQGVKAQFANFSDEFSQRTFLSSAPTNFIKAAEVATPSVVNIRAIAGSQYGFWDGEAYGASTGSGVIVSADGLIVTNNHVIEGSNDIQVTLSDRRELKAKIIGTDPSTDLALLKIEESNLPTVIFGNSDSIRVGEWVLAVGNPFNLSSTVTAGIVSAKARDINILEDKYRIESFIQTDAAVNPGNSGGALINTNGELVGINTAIITQSGRYEGYSFAVPSNIVRKVIKDLREYGIVQRGILGISIEEVTEEVAKELDLKNIQGVVITRITPNGGAEAAGLRQGDVIISVNNHMVNSVPELQEQIAGYRPGNKVEVAYFREGSKRNTAVTLKNIHSGINMVKSDRILRDIGFELRNLNNNELNKWKKSGVKVISIFRNSKVARTNMEPGFIITKVNEKPIKDIDMILDILNEHKGKVMLEGFYENYQGDYYYAFAL
ncbi:MAG: Do family serine endopeptidase [Saprospiraceae bacterium]|nr:Do family serine endopeptidase [Saprospiraceae bacterium]MBP7699027.1 Do family serine endopeptidase [Saprospiraceae bacterium]